MKTPLTFSILLNGLLLGALGVSLTCHEKSVAIPVAPAALSEANSASQTEVAQPFRWNQLESTNDYRSYVANLRAIGCPEPTIRAIVTADFETATSFEQRRLQVLGKTNFSISRAATQQAVARVLGEMAGSSRIEDFKTPSPAIASSPSQPSFLRPAGQTIARASYPVIFQNTVQNDTTLTENQKAAVRQLQQQFVDAVGGANQDPTDPAYAASWQTAQQDADDALRAQLGNQTYLAYKQQHYYSNFQQVMLNAGDGPVTINPKELAK